jgi:SET domain-containing protein
MEESKKMWITPKVTIQNSSMEGREMFAIEPILKGEKVVIFGGLYTDRKGAEKVKKKGKLVMQWDNDLFSIEERGDDPTYYINHSCDPNIWMEDAYTLVARRNIPSGEEVVADYAMWEADEDWVASWQCKCDSELCGGKITGKDWRNPKLQEMYKGHFSPLLNRRIGKYNFDDSNYHSVLKVLDS